MFWIRVKQITAKDAKALVEEEGVTMIDVRRAEDYEKAHVDGAISADKNKVHETFSAEDKSKPVICYCYMGVSSRVACNNLKKAGFKNVLNLKGGYDAWKKTWGES
jgi:rhodanese-related sulfurtransferase